MRMKNVVSITNDFCSVGRIVKSKKGFCIIGPDDVVIGAATLKPHKKVKKKMGNKNKKVKV
jgi:hypothetical protein